MYAYVYVMCVMRAMYASMYVMHVRTYVCLFVCMLRYVMLCYVCM